MNTTAPTLPAEGSSATFPCPRCRVAHPFAAEHAGRTARCACGTVFKFPAVMQIPAAPPAPASLPAAPPPPVPSDDSASQVPAFLRMNSHPIAGDEALPPEIEAELAETARYGEEDPNKPDPKRDFHVPMALLVVGFLLTVVDVGLATRAHPGAAMAVGILIAGVKLVFGTVLVLGGALLAARFAGINFGPIGPALLKLAALCIAPSALGDLTTTLLGGDMAVAQLGWVVRVVLYWALVSYLFRLDGGQTVVVVGSITVVKVATTVLLGSVLLFGLMPSADFGAAGADEQEMTGLERDLKALEPHLDETHDDQPGRELEDEGDE